jgi:hypothetical protein
MGDVVRCTVKGNTLPDAEANRLCRAERYERTEARKDTRARSTSGGYTRR